MPFFLRDGLQFHYLDTGEGIPFCFQHGLGGDVNQPFGLFKPPAGFRLLALDCRGHGDTYPLGDPERITFSVFAEDVLALLDYLNISQAIIGGISMGAAVALHFALRFPRRVLGVVLSRPAWLDGPMPPQNRQIFAQIAQAIRHHGAKRGAEQFKQSQPYAAILRQAPETASSLAKQFEHPRAEETVVKLECLPDDTPGYDRTMWSQIHVPTLVLANRQDPIHPFEYGQVLAETIPTAEFQELTPKSVSPAQHISEVQTFIERFLKCHFLAKTR